MSPFTTSVRNFKASAASLTALVLSAGLHAAEDVDAFQLLEEFEDTLEEFRNLEREGLEIIETRENNREEINQLNARNREVLAASDALNEEILAYQEEAAGFNSECVSASLSSDAQAICQRRSTLIDRQAAELSRQAEEIGPRIEEYNAAVQAFNQQDEELARQSEANFAYYQAMEREIVRMKQAFQDAADASGDREYMLDVKNCTGLNRFEHTLTCLKTVVDIANP